MSQVGMWLRESNKHSKVAEPQGSHWDVRPMRDAGLTCNNLIPFPYAEGGSCISQPAPHAKCTALQE